MAPRGVIVTGGRTGIGLGIARAFLANGDKVVLISRSVDKVKEEDDIDRYVKSGQAILVAADLTKVKESAQVIEKCVQALGGRLDVLVNNAGFGSSGETLHKTSYETYREHFDLNLDSYFFLIQAATPELEKYKGSVVNISSIAGKKPVTSMITYSLTKAALDMLTRGAAAELASKGVRVNSVNPGMVESEFFAAAGMVESKEQRDDLLKEQGQSYPLGRVGKPSDIANLVLFLADNEKSPWVTGQTIVADGGVTLS